MVNKDKNIIEDKEICEGIAISRSFFQSQENRLLTLLIKGFIVYLLSMGSIGFYLSAFEINYNVIFCHLTILVIAICCAMLYYRLFTENFGYLMLLILFGSLVVLFKDYINSGFYAIVNITVDKAAQYFDIEVQRLYNEKIGNRYLTVSMAVVFIGIVLDILLNVYVSRRMQYMTVIFIVLFFNVIPLYLISEPNLTYTIMMLCGIVLTYSFKAGRHYSPQISIKRTNQIYENEKKKRKSNRKRSANRELSYVYNAKAMVQGGICLFVITLVVCVFASASRPKDSFNTGYEGNKYKELSMAAVSTVMTDGLMGLFRDSENVGGMNGGRLGDVSSIRLDYQTDLLVRVTPYSYAPIYLKGFTGQFYNPYYNNWTAISRETINAIDDTAEAKAYSVAFDNKKQNSAKGTMCIKNVGLGYDSIFLPYYNDTFEYDDYGFNNITYYPSFENNVVYVDDDYYDNAPFTNNDLYVPEENLPAIQDFVLNLNRTATDEEIIRQIKQYFQDNIPYTIKPGKTPRNDDFINYFLQENKKGYCAHFASAATLIFRYLGIPARYIEGYAIDYYQLLNGELVENATYSDYYEGYSELGETALVEVNVTDADAHAWVEVYVDGKGWCVVDVTPYSSETEEVTEDFWSMFEDVFGDGDDSNADEIVDNRGGFAVSDKLVKKICSVILGIIIAAALFFLMIRIRRYIIYRIKYKNATINDRLIMEYHSFRLKIARKNKDFKEKINFREQIIWLLQRQVAGGNELSPNGALNYDKELADDLTSVFEQAGFSDKSITGEQYDRAVMWMHEYNKKAI